MATRSGGSKKSASGAKKPASRAKKPAASSARKTSTSAKRKSSRGRAAAEGRSDKSVQAFRDAVERSRTALESNVTVSRDRLQEVVDDLVKRGRIQRGDANELVSNIVDRGRKATDELMRDLEKLLDQARKEVESRTVSTRKQATKAAERVGRVARDAAERQLAEADKLRRRVGVGDGPITGYHQLTAAQIRARLKDLNKAELRKVRTAEKRGKARKSILDDIETRLEK